MSQHLYGECGFFGQALKAANDRHDILDHTILWEEDVGDVLQPRH